MAAPSTPATPDAVLEALRVHLSPTPLATHLPTALQLFAHLTLLADRVRNEASFCLSLNSDGEFAHSLSGADVSVLIRCASREVRNMQRLSMDLRREHLRLLITAKTLHRKGILDTLDTYFPEHDEQPHKMLFIRAAQDEELPEIATRRVEVEKWLEMAIAAEDRRQPPPSIPQGRTLAELGEEVLRLAERTVKDAQGLMYMFEPAKNRKRARTSLPGMGQGYGQVVREKRARLSMPAPRVKRSRSDSVEISVSGERHAHARKAILRS